MIAAENEEKYRRNSDYSAQAGLKKGSSLSEGRVGVCPTNGVRELDENDEVRLSEIQLTR